MRFRMVRSRRAAALKRVSVPRPELATRHGVLSQGERTASVRRSLAMAVSSQLAAQHRLPHPEVFRHFFGLYKYTTGAMAS